MRECFFEVLDENGDSIDQIHINGCAMIGRAASDATPDIQIPAECRSASRSHATMQVELDKTTLSDHSRFGTLVNGELIHNSSTPIKEGDDIIFGQLEDGWHVRFGEVSEIYRTQPVDPLEFLVVTDVPRQVRIGRTLVEERLGDKAFRLLKFLSDHKGNWYTTEFLISHLWPDPHNSPDGANEQLSRHKKTVNDLLAPYLGIEESIEAWPLRGYRMKRRSDE